MSKLWKIGGLCLIFAIFHSLCSVQGEPKSKEVRKEERHDIQTLFNRLEDMDHETVTHDPALKIFREDNKDKKGSPTQSGSISKFDKDDSGSRE